MRNSKQSVRWHKTVMRRREIASLHNATLWRQGIVATCVLLLKPTLPEKELSGMGSFSVFQKVAKKLPKNGNQVEPIGTYTTKFSNKKTAEKVQISLIFQRFKYGIP